MSHWGMVIDLKKCIGCWACAMACRQEHFLPRGVLWSKVITGEVGKYPAVRKEMYPVQCNHCSEAACVKVCPTGATSRREDGIVVIEADKCMGCRYCLIACPYQSRTYYEHSENYFPGQGLTEFEVIGQELYPLEQGTVVKCNFCVDRIDAGLARGLKAGVDREATQACVNACPTNARCFGDLDDPESEVSLLIKGRRGTQLHPEFGTDPSLYYLM